MGNTSWKPISEAELAVMLDGEEASMSPSVLAFWHRIRIRPEKWQLPPWGDAGGGFWVVGILGQDCIWYNDIEEGFNISRYEKTGHIHEYLCNQDHLELYVRLYFEQFMQELK
jgi:hypothetical protein